jgi:hypothetical protein
MFSNNEKKKSQNIIFTGSATGNPTPDWFKGKNEYVFIRK